MRSIDILAKKSGEFCAVRIVLDLDTETEKTYYIPLFFGHDYLVRAACLLNEVEIISSIRVPLEVQFTTRKVIFRHGIMDATKSAAILWGQPNK